MTYQPIEIGVGWPINVKVSATDIVNGFVVDHEGTVRVLKGGVSAQGRVVRLNNSSSNLRCRVDSKLKLGFLAIVNRESLHKEGGEA